jgi:hypothetical protein
VANVLPCAHRDVAGHRAAADELRQALARLQPAEQHIRAYTELSFGLAFHLLSVGVQQRFGVHREQHAGLVRWLRTEAPRSQPTCLTSLSVFPPATGTAAREMDMLQTASTSIVAALDTWALA